MNAVIILNGEDITSICRLSDTRINYDSSRRISTASLTIMGVALNRVARYDSAHYGEDHYSTVIEELYAVTILDGRDGLTKLFEGHIFTLSLEQTDAPTYEVFYHAELNDYASWLDRAICWDTSFPLTMPASDKAIIQALLAEFCPRIDATLYVNELVPVIQAFDWKTKTCRQVLDDLAALSMADWRVDFDAVLHYGAAAAGPTAPFGLSTSPDYVTTFPVRVGGYRHDFNNPVNRAYIRGAPDASTGVAIEASYADPISISQYGEFACAVVDEQITTAWDAALRAKSTVLRYAYPIESGNFTIWKDGLRVGMNVAILEEGLGIDGEYVIRALSMQWEDQYTVRYEAQFGAAQADLETLLRLLEQRSRWKTSKLATAGSVAPGSVTDASIAPGGLHAQSIASVNATTIQGVISAGQIGSVNASTILGMIQAGQIQTVNAGAIVGVVQAGQIGSVNATTIQGAISAGQIGSVSATTIQGVIVSQQLADQIIDTLGKYATALRPVPMLQAVPTLPSADYRAGTYFYYVPDGHFYKITSDGLSWTRDDNPQNALMNFYHIGAINAHSITGLILAAQIDTITAGQITGAIQAAQIGAVNASSISGQVTAGQIATVNAAAIQGTITSTQIASVNASAIQGTITSTQIASVSATTITGTLVSTQIGSIDAASITIGLIQNGQIGNVSGAKLTVGTVASDKLDTYSINVGGAGNKPGRINVYNASNQQIAQIGTLDSGQYGGWFQVFGAAGTGYNDAKIKSDTSGNLSITNATFTITASGYTALLSPTTFDASYGSLALKISDASNSSWTVSRGIVIYSGSNVIGALVRDPGNTSNTQLVLYGGASNTILLDGGTGFVRALGFQVGGTPGFNGQIPAGHAINVTNGMVTGYV